MFDIPLSSILSWVAIYVVVWWITIFAVLPIGDWFTMGPTEAAVALELLGNPRCVPSHWGTFSLLTGTPDALAREAPNANIERLEPGDSIEL